MKGRTRIFFWTSTVQVEHDLVIKCRALIVAMAGFEVPSGNKSRSIAQENIAFKTANARLAMMRPPLVFWEGVRLKQGSCGWWRR